MPLQNVCLCIGFLGGAKDFSRYTAKRVCSFPLDFFKIIHAIWGRSKQPKLSPSKPRKNGKNISKSCKIFRRCDFHSLLRQVCKLVSIQTWGLPSVPRSMCLSNFVILASALDAENNVSLGGFERGSCFLVSFGLLGYFFRRSHLVSWS